MLQCLEQSTDYSVVSKAASVATTTAAPPPTVVPPLRSFKGRIQTTTPAARSATGSRPLAVGVAEAQQELVGINSKSYISGPTTQPSKLSKRAGLSGPKKFPKDVRNRSSSAVERNKLQHEVPDHVPDSSGYIPHRIGHPVHLDYGSTGVDSSGAPTGSGGYHAVPYEGSKWHEEYWDQEYAGHPYQQNSTRVQHIEAECQDDYMKIRIGFNGSFNGLLYSAGYAYDPDCMYINGSGRDYYEFYIQLNRCGTLGKNSLQEESRKNPTNFMWNTVTVQYNPLIEEEYDEHFKVTCEYGYDFWKTVTFPFLDVEVATGNPVVFTLSPPECYMEIQNGYGIGGPRVTGPVHVGDPLTLIIYMRSKYGELDQQKSIYITFLIAIFAHPDGFDIVVNDCYAHNGANKRIQLIDQHGCPVDDKLISRFRGSWSDSGVYETQVYAYMKTFRFTGSPALYIECDVRMCHGRCPSQPCHWRNLKAVTKRDTSNMTATNLSLPPLSVDSEGITTESPAQASLSENVNLFQSLRVLQEGENDGDDVYAHRQTKPQQAHQTCLKTSTFSALTAGCSAILCILTVTLFVACSRLKRRKESSLYDSYIAHKGQID
ncbi:hypothetical protein KR018_003578 [Drosophila ironensis]|nr:hypothetical protein KR018_003578 [Drosophila ironensis]